MTDTHRPAVWFEHLPDAIFTLDRYAWSRDRAIEREPRTITITDDQAAALLTALGNAATERTTP